MAAQTAKNPGYPALARLMADFPELAQLRSFLELRFLNLLRLQAELQDLETQLSDIREEDAASGDSDLLKYEKDFRHMRTCREDGKDSLQLDMLELIGRKLSEYDDALEQTRRTMALARPQAGDAEALRQWLQAPGMGNGFLSEREEGIWSAENANDLVTLLPRDAQRDGFSHVLEGRILDAYHRIWGQRKVSAKPGQNHMSLRWYDRSALEKISKVVSAVLSSLLPTLTILILYYVKSVPIRIGLTIVFTTIFALMLAIFSAATKAEIFATASAFAAVEVVFIGSSSSPP